MNDPVFRDLRADEIELRVGRVTPKGVELLMYKDARCDMAILDETVGPLKWQRRHETIDGVSYCTVSIYDARSETWVAKQDAGVASSIEPEKGAASDAFKRACVNWGIGRELYTAPRIFVPKSKYRERDGGGTWDEFAVKKIVIEGHRILAVAVENKRTGKLAFVWIDERYPIQKEEEKGEAREGNQDAHCRQGD